MSWHDPEVSDTYARALVEAVRKKGQLEPSLRQAEDLVNLLLKTPKLRAFIEGPHIVDRDKDGLIQRLILPRVLPVLGNFLRLLVRRRRIEYLLDILESYKQQVKEALGWTPGVVTSAVQMTAMEQQRLKTALERRTGLKLDLEWRVDAELLGGFRARFGDLLLDGTVRSRLSALEERLYEAVTVGEV